MQGIVVNGAERDRELVADFEAHASLLSVADVVRLRGLAPADEAGVRGDGLEVLGTSMPLDRGDRQSRLVDACLNMERDRRRPFGAVQFRPFEIGDRDHEIGVVQTSPIAQIGMNALEALELTAHLCELSVDVGDT